MGKDYVCTLDAATARKAQEELNEVASDRLSAVAALRAWLEQQPHLTAPDFGGWGHLDRSIDALGADRGKQQGARHGQ